jgi:hypothetical protein
MGGGLGRRMEKLRITDHFYLHLFYSISSGDLKLVAPKKFYDIIETFK